MKVREVDEVLKYASAKIAERFGVLRDPLALAQILRLPVRRLDGSKLSPTECAGRIARKAGTNDGYFAVYPTPHVVLLQRGGRSELTSRQRFTLAHEIGHFLVWKGTGNMPDDRDYWHHEAACNRFAARLLVPDDAVLLAINSGAAWPYWPGVAAKDSAVSWEVAANRITEYVGPTIVYMRMARTASASRLRIVFSSTVGASNKKLGTKVIVDGGPLFAVTNEFLPNGEKTFPMTHDLGSLQSTGAECVLHEESFGWRLSLRRPAPMF